MVIFSIKKLEDNIKNKNISTKQFMIYSFFVFGGISSFIGTTIYQTNSDTQTILNILKLIPIIITIIQFYFCYKIVNGKDINLFLYSIIPISFVLRLRYILFLFLPLVILNMVIIQTFNLNTDFWNIINSQIISIIMNLFLAFHFIRIIKRIFGGSE